MWYACAHVHVHAGMCVYMYEYVQRSEADSECLSLLFSTVLFQSDTQNLEHMDSIRLAVQQVPGIFMLCLPTVGITDICYYARLFFYLSIFVYNEI